MKRWLIGVGFAVVAGAAAAEPVRSPQECVLLGDSAVVAHALHRAGIADAKIAEVLIETHLPFVPEDGLARWRVYLTKMVRLVNRKDMQEITPAALGTTFAKVCHAANGDVDKIFGSDI